MKPLAVDLYCGLGGWTEGLIAEGWDVVGFDIEAHAYGGHRYPAQLVLQDVRTLHGRQFKNAALIVASPPCQAYSWRAMPWRAARAAPPPDNELFDACFRIQREACEAAGRHIPMVVENVRGAQKWVGRSRWNFGSYHLWGDVPALMPMAVRLGVKVGGIDWRRGDSFNGTAESRLGCKGGGDGWVDDARRAGGTMDDLKRSLSWASSRSPRRKAASALIAKIPLDLGRHIGRVYYPREAGLAGTET